MEQTGLNACEAYEEYMLDQDYILYMQDYDSLMKKVWKPRTSATMTGKIQHSGPPLDFSFLKLQDVQSLKKERPRAGKRKAIEKDEDEEENKNKDLNPALGDDKIDGEKPKEEKEKGVVQVVKAANVAQIHTLQTNHYVSLQQTKNAIGGRKLDDGKEEQARKKQIEYVVDSLLLNTNCIRDIKGLASVLTYVLPHGDPTKLLWLNLSYNYLVKIDMEILNFPCLKSLQLHGNFINDLEEVRKLNQIGTLQMLALNGNPIEEIQGYRFYVLGLMYAKYETLRKLDSVIISRTEFDNVLVWNERLFKSMHGNPDENKPSKLRKLRPKSPKQPPAKLEDENAKNGQQAAN